MALGGAVVAIVCWGIGPLVIRAIVAPTVVLAFWRMWLGALATGVIARVASGRLPGRAVLRAAAPAGVLFALSLVTGWQSVKETSIANAQLIPALQPILVLFAARRLFGERVGRVAVGCALVGVAGVAGFVLGADATAGATLRGDLWAVGNLLAWTVYFLEMKRLRDRGIDTLVLLTAVLVTGSLALTPFVLATTGGIPPLEGAAWLGVVFVVAVPGLGGHGLTTYAQRYVDVTVLSLLGLATPVLSAAGAWIVYDQPLRGVQVLAGATVIVALAGLLVEHRRRQTEQPVGVGHGDEALLR